MKNSIILHEQIADNWSYTWNDNSTYVGPSAREVLQELVNTPIIKIPFWIEQHKQQLEAIEIILKEESTDEKERNI